MKGASLKKPGAAKPLLAGKTVEFNFRGTGMILVMPVPLLAAHPRECPKPLNDFREIGCAPAELIYQLKMQVNQGENR